MKKKVTHTILYALAITVALMFMISKLVYNKMIDEEHFLHISHGKLVAELQKRADLNSRASQAVKVYVGMEGELTHRLINLAREVKTGADAARILAMRGELERLISSMDILVMNSPSIKAKGPYIYLMETYKATENSVLAARLQYNIAACEYDLFLDKFPYRYVAWFYGFKKAHIFTAEKGAENPPDIDRQGI